MECYLWCVLCYGTGLSHWTCAGEGKMKGDSAVVFCASPFKVIAASGNSTQRFRFGLRLLDFGLQ